MMDITEMTADEVVAAVGEACAQLDVLLVQLEDARMVEPYHVFDDWTVKDVLAHLTAWSRLEIGWIEAVLRGETPKLYAPGFDWGGLHHPQSFPAIHRYNAHVLEENKDRSLNDVLADFRATQDGMREVVSRLPDHVLADPGALFWLGEVDREPWRPVPINGYEHYFWHIDLLRAWMEAEKR
jgi:hypothetical protein